MAANQTMKISSRVLKINDFPGRLSPRPLYIYLPPGYDDEPTRHYPVLYMHDGQNCFEAYVQDSNFGSWRADETADLLIQQGLVRPFIIVGVSHGGEDRIAEYLPPYAHYAPDFVKRQPSIPIAVPQGRADQTFAYYRNDVAPTIQNKFRVLTGREHTATCGSSMGGLFSTYIAWQYPDFAQQHAIVSPAYWIERDRNGRFPTIEHLKHTPPPHVRLWLDSGTQDSPGQGDDGLPETTAARDALLANSFTLGPDFQFFVEDGAVHNESAWAKRLPQIFQFLFPPNR
jgi:predicted alpha/beta superfamily hydrolase